jgi:uncharacterized membrane protein
MNIREQVWDQNVGTQLAGLDFAAGMAVGILALVMIVWITYWKFKAIWHAVKHDQKIWVIVFLLVNTVGILEILYLYWFSKYHRTS